MAIKAGQILHVSGSAGQSGFVIDRIQTGGVTGINVNETRVEELGNVEAIGTIRDIPDLTFELQSYDVTTELESILLGGDNTEVDGSSFDLSAFVPLDILSPFKNSGLYTIASSVIIPFLSLESMAYSFSLTDSGSVTATLRGDSIFYIRGGSAYRDVFDGDGSTVAFNFANTALKSAISGSDYYGLSVMYDDGNGWQRMRLGTDYTNSAAAITFTTAPVVGTGNIAVVYGSATQATYGQAVHDATKPVGVRGRDIFVRLGDGNATPTYTSWVGVQSANINWRVTLDRDEEFGNPQVVAQDFDVPEVTGTVNMKPSAVDALFAQIQAITNVSGTDIVNATQDPPELQVEVKVTDPADGTTLKTLFVPDAKFSAPALQNSVGNKLATDFNFTSSGGSLTVYKSDPA